MEFLKHNNTVKIISNTYGTFICDGHSCKYFMCLHDKSNGEYYYHLICRLWKMKIYSAKFNIVGTISQTVYSDSGFKPGQAPILKKIQCIV